MITSIDLRDDPATVAEQIDATLQQSGFMLVTGHGVPAELRAEVRKASRGFFALDPAVKNRYAATVGGRGWLPTGVEANGYAEGTETPPDLKETFAIGADTPVGDPVVDDAWFLPNVWPSEVPALRRTLLQYETAMRTLADRLLRACADALGLETDFFVPTHPTWTLNLNWYPSLGVVGEPEEGQYRIGPHTDFGTLTLLDREYGSGGLQVFTADGVWVDAPYDPDAFTINVGDLLARWTGDRWLSARHRVLPPQADAPDEDLVSLVYFYEANHDTVVHTLEPPIGRTAHPPVVSGDFIRERLDAITIN
ncbi:isopenicillin N synthase family dioxygenase [Cryptosporangium phraense]|uniref:Isopenicillin N synthase family oxygenase n=1 Tax=Cryptosporangium phraense TaxID=2593070 RepID=A0A545AJN1_9ACTN|nr:2-oxoglutarate and iron-dependent oxygenase domain-containing protein [Cryptosporangium phraense]TQS41521.1 isopenicillin N synthase family oxygenase [Cryptosporangium phraense]